MKKYCVKCGKPFDAVGREVICPACKAQAAEDARRAAVERAKRASWTGESVPVRISGRASTIIREYGAAHSLPFAAALDALLQASDYFAGLDKAWEDITPYKSHRRDKHTADATLAPDTPDTPHEIRQAAKQTSKATTSKATTSKASASKASKAAGKAASKAKTQKK